MRYVQGVRRFRWRWLVVALVVHAVLVFTLLAVRNAWWGSPASIRAGDSLQSLTFPVQGIHDWRGTHFHPPQWLLTGGTFCVLVFDALGMLTRLRKGPSPS